MSRDLLMPLVKKRKTRSYLVLDIETKDGETQKAGFTRPFMAALYDGDRYLEFKGPECLMSLCEVLLQPCYAGHYIYAHAGGSFDFLHLMQHLLKLSQQNEYELEIVPVSCSIQAIRIKHRRHVWTFLDSYKLIPLSLAKASQSFGGVTKLADHDLDMHESDGRWSKYLRLDCISLFEVLQRFHAIVEGELSGEVGVTAAATAMRTFRRGYMKAPIERVQEEHDFVRAGYYGGNTQAFIKHGKGLHYYDINSSYPAAMKGAIPQSLIGVFEREEPPGQAWEVGLGFCDVLVSIDSDHPCLPYRDPETGRLLFPRGTFRGTWSSEELAYAIEHHNCVILKWYRSVWYSKSYALSGYVDALYKYRDKSLANYDDGVALVAKLLLNSLYGKFGMKTLRERIVILQPMQVPPEDARPASSDPDCDVWYIEEETDADYIIPQIAATITARARIQLQRIIDAAAKRGIVAYCDTDSVITTADLSDLCGSELGAVKDEGSGDTFEGWFLQPKLYKLVNERTGESKVAMKGYRKPDAALFDRVASGETIIKQELEKLGALAKAGFRRGPLMREVKKRLVSEDKKRVWLPDGFSLPLTIEPQELAS